MQKGLAEQEDDGEYQLNEKELVTGLSTVENERIGLEALFEEEKVSVRCLVIGRKGRGARRRLRGLLRHQIRLLDGQSH